MELWKLVLDEAAFQIFIGLRFAERRKTLEQLKRNPQHKHDFGIRDIAGRSLSVLVVTPFLVTYWLDDLVSEVRVVDIQRVRC